MKRIRISTTELKEKISEIINEVNYGKAEITVERHGKVVAKIVPIPDNDVLTVNDVAELTYGMLKDSSKAYFPSEDPEERKRNIRRNSSLKSWSEKY